MSSANTYSKIQLLAGELSLFSKIIYIRKIVLITINLTFDEGHFRRYSYNLSCTRNRKLGIKNNQNQYPF